jgi:molybdenum cofactor cytidylyltransferase
VAGLVLAAGGSTRLGRAKQTLPYKDTTLLGHVLDCAHACAFNQLVVVLGGHAGEVRSQVDLTGTTVAHNPNHEGGCASSIAAALPALDPRADVLVLMLGDQPGVGPTAVRTLRARQGDAPIAVCCYEDGRGHPFSFRRELFPRLAELRGDKAVWTLLDERAEDVVEVRVPGRVPPDVDTWEDYEALTG